MEIRAGGSVTPVATDFVTGGANGTMGPFSKAVAFDAPPGGGAIILKTFGTENNILWEACVFRVQFSQGQPAEAQTSEREPLSNEQR